MSLIQSNNKIGPSLLPWGITALISLKLLLIPQTTVHWKRELKYDSNKFLRSNPLLLA